MPNPLHICPECRAASLRCRRTHRDYASAEHELEMARQSVWECRVCGSRFVLDTPAGKLKKLKNSET